MFDLLIHAAPSAWRRAREPLVRALLARRGAARTVNGIPLRVDPVGRHVFTPIYDEGAAGCLRTHLREGMEAWNVGANIGVYALQLAHLVGAAGHRSRCIFFVHCYGMAGQSIDPIITQLRYHAPV